MQADYLILSLPPAVGDIIKHAGERHRSPDRSRRPSYYAAPLRYGMATDFHTVLDPADRYHGVYFRYPPDDPQAPVTIVSDCGHLDRYSLRLRSDGDPVVGHGDRRMPARHRGAALPGIRLAEDCTRQRFCLPPRHGVPLFAG